MQNSEKQKLMKLIREVELRLADMRRLLQPQDEVVWEEHIKKLRAKDKEELLDMKLIDLFPEVELKNPATKRLFTKIYRRSSIYEQFVKKSLTIRIFTDESKYGYFTFYWGHNNHIERITGKTFDLLKKILSDLDISFKKKQ